MKKKLGIVLALAVMSTSAFASKARLISLGEDSQGSYYIDDLRNVFLNPAAVNDHNGTATLEFGSNTDDSDSTAKSEAGIWQKSGNFNYGVYLGGANSKYDDLRSGITVHQAAADGHQVEVDNSGELFIGGNAGMKWGASLLFSQSEDEAAATQSEQELMILKLGIIKNKMQAFLHFVSSNEAEDTSASQKFESDSDITLGFSYDLSSWRAFAEVRSYEYDDADGDNNNVERMDITLGMGKTKNLSNKTKLYTKVELTQETMEEAAVETSSMVIPLTVAIEADVKNWLTLRGSVAQNIWGEAEDANKKKSTPTGTTNVNAGATLKFGDLSIDGVLGANNGSGNVANTDSEVGVLTFDNFMTRVSLTYKY